MLPRLMLIRRDFRGYTGGHGKFRDYVAHIDAHPRWSARVCLSGESTKGSDNPFLDVADLTDQWAPDDADALLVGGMDWLAVPVGFESSLPIINLVQHVRHADPDLPLRRFLGRHAVRICVSTPVADAITATGEVNGPVRVIPAAVDTHMLASLGMQPATGSVFIDGVKQPRMACEVASILQARSVYPQVITQRIPRSEYLKAMAHSRIVLTLPDPTEGFYLPGLEAMAMGRPLVQPDCMGGREYARDGGETALVPPRNAQLLADAALTLLADPSEQARLIGNGQRRAAAFDLAQERACVHALLDEIDMQCTP